MFVVASAATSFNGGWSFGINDVIAEVDGPCFYFALTPAAIFGLFSFSAAVLAPVAPFAMRDAWRRSELLFSLMTGIMQIGCMLLAFYSTDQFVKINLVLLSSGSPSMDFDAGFAALLTVVSGFGPFAFFGGRPSSAVCERPRGATIQRVALPPKTRAPASSVRLVTSQVRESQARTQGRRAKAFRQSMRDSKSLEATRPLPPVDRAFQVVRVSRSPGTITQAAVPPCRTPRCPLPSISRPQQRGLFNSKGARLVKHAADTKFRGTLAASDANLVDDSFRVTADFRNRILSRPARANNCSVSLGGCAKIRNVAALLSEHALALVMYLVEFWSVLMSWFQRGAGPRTALPF